MKYIAIIDEKMLDDFRIDEPILCNGMSVNDKVMVVTDKLGFTRGIQLKPIQKEIKQDPCEDAVNRQSVLNTLDNMDKALDEDRTVENYKELLKECYEVLPSVTPQPTRWIPVSERLPEEEGWYLVTIQNDKTEKRRTENDLFAIGIAEAHKLTPYKFCKDGHRQTVIAWMPLPEPYRAESEDN